VKDSDGTLVIYQENIDNGTAYTIKVSKDFKRPLFIYNMTEETDINKVTEWISKNQIKVLNIAGPRESKSPGIYKESFELLEKLFL